jgi:tetratricopeptide (TPR) repeat protein
MSDTNRSERLVRAQQLRQSGESARRCYEDAVALLREVGEPLVLAHVIRHLGDVYLEQECPELAEPCYHEALRLYRSQGDSSSLDLANAIRSLAVLRWEQSGALWKEAKELYTNLSIKSGIEETTARLIALAKP